MTDCPNCEYHRQRAQLWRDEAYKQAGHPLPERGWVRLTDEEVKNIVWNLPYEPSQEHIRAIEAAIRSKNS